MSTPQTATPGSENLWGHKRSLDPRDEEGMQDVTNGHEGKFVKIGRGGKLMGDITPNMILGKTTCEIDDMSPKVKLHFDYPLTHLDGFGRSSKWSGRPDSLSKSPKRGPRHRPSHRTLPAACGAPGPAPKFTSCNSVQVGPTGGRVGTDCHLKTGPKR